MIDIIKIQCIQEKAKSEAMFGNQWKRYGKKFIHESESLGLQTLLQHRGLPGRLRFVPLSLTGRIQKDGRGTGLERRWDAD